MMCGGFIKTWTDMIAIRLILGVFEAGFFPGCAYLLSCWYPRYELQKRNAVFYLIGSMASAFAGILAYGFSQLKNHGSGPKWWGQHYGPTAENPDITPGILPGIAGWRWIFILQGVVTCVMALVSYFLIVDFPEKATQTFGLKFLNQKEVDFVVARIERDRHDAIPEEFNVWKYLKGGLDLKVWGFAALFGLTTTNTYAIAYFLPQILNEGMGFDVAASQCLIAPPYVLAAILMYAVAVLGDRWHLRSPFILLNGCLLLIGKFQPGPSSGFFMADLISQVFPFLGILTTSQFATLVFLSPSPPATPMCRLFSLGKPTTSEASGRELCAQRLLLVPEVSGALSEERFSARKTRQSITQVS